METQNEKRAHQRYSHKTPLYLHRMDFQDISYFAEMRDYSKGGMSIITSEKLIVDQLIYLEMKNYDKSSTGPEKSKNYSGSVKWVKDDSSSANHKKGLYRYGIQYL